MRCVIDACHQQADVRHCYFVMLGRGSDHWLQIEGTAA